MNFDKTMFIKKLVLFSFFWYVIFYYNLLRSIFYWFLSSKSRPHSVKMAAPSAATLDVYIDNKYFRVWKGTVTDGMFIYFPD